MADLPDSRFAAFDADLRSAATRVVSLDCFDTLLWRRVPKPTDIHLLVGTRLHDEGILASHLTPQGYANLRVLAEEDVRRRQKLASGSSEVTLQEIHQLLEPAIVSKSLDGVCAATEIEVERENLFTDLRLAKYLRHFLAEASVRLIVVSDTYFGADHLRSFLAQPPLSGIEFDAVYTSSDQGTGKGDHLWQKVVEDQQVPADQIVHIGDNEEADALCARRIGIRAFHYPSSTQRFAPVEVRERIIGDGTYPSRYCDVRRGDAGISALRRRATWAPPGRTVDADERIAWETGTSVFGPVFTGFAQWIHERSRDEGAQRLLFLMREGRFLKQLVDRAAPVGSWRPDTRTVWVSREACARASVYEGTAPELGTFLDRLSPPSPAELVSSLGLEPSDIPGFGRFALAFESSPDREELNRSLLELVLNQSALVEKVVESSAARRRRFMDYVKKTAGSGEGPIGLVDVGWSGSIQESLKEMFDRNDEPLEFQGFYLLAHRGSSRRALRGSRLQGFLGTVGTNPFDIAGITGSAEIVELISTCEEGSLLEIGEGGEPVLAAPIVAPRERSCRELLQQGVLRYQEEWLRYRQPDLPTFETTASGVDLLARIMKRFISLPNQDEAGAFSWWLHEENYGSEDTEHLVPRRFLPTLVYRTAEDLHETLNSELHWTGGAAALVDRETTDAIFLMREASIDPGRFSSPPGPSFGLRLVTGTGEGAAIAVPIMRNRRGLSLVEWRGPASGATGVVLRPAETFTLARLDLVEVVDESAEADSAPLFRWSKGDEPRLLPAQHGRWVTSQVMAVDGTSTIAVEFPAPVTSHRLRITVAGVFFPDSPGPPDAALRGDPEDEIAALRQEIENIYRTKLFRFAAFPRRIYGAMRRR